MTDLKMPWAAEELKLRPETKGLGVRLGALGAQVT